MKYVSDHLTKHHLFHAPHQWFFAVLLSPIHAAELHYERRYHLQYAHAKKLFAFDMFLLVSVLLLTTATFFWFTYNPTVTDAIELTISTTSLTNASARRNSGDTFTILIQYKNASPKKLLDATLALHMPDGFVLSATDPVQSFSDHNSFVLGAIAPGAEGAVSVTGRWYGTPQQEEPISAQLSYLQEHRTERETKVARLFATLRGSVIETTLTGLSSTVFSHSAMPVTITLHNTSDEALPAVVVDLPSTTGTHLSNISVATGTLSGSHWQLTKLPAFSTVTATATVHFDLAPAIHTTTLTTVPSITSNGQTFPQTAAVLPLTVQTPDISINGGWSDTGALIPGNSSAITFTITNNTAQTVHNGHISIPIPPGILNTDTTLIHIDSAINSALKHIQPHDTVAVTIPISLRPFIDTGEQPPLSLTPTVSVTFDGVSIPFTSTMNLPVRPIATSIRMQAESRYYTVDGDQLGRGPLPPTVGKETKYWVFITLKNGTGTAVGTTVSAALPPGVTVTGKHSLTAGNPISLTPNTRDILWTIPTLSAHEEAGLYFEVAITPTFADQGRIVTLLQNIILKGTDEALGVKLNTAAPDLDTNIPHDTIGKKKGVTVR